MSLPNEPSGPALTRLHRANALLAGARASEAAAEFAAVLDAQPEWLVARHGLVRSLLADGDFVNALLAATDTRLFDARDAFAAVLADFTAAGAPQQHADLLRAYLQRHAHDIDAALALAAAAHTLGHPGEALRWSAHVLAARPQARTALEIRAASLVDRGDVEAGLAIYRDLLRDGDAETAARHLVLMHYDPAQTSEGLFAAHRDFAQRHLPARDAGLQPRVRKPGAMRIGWLSPRLAGGPVASFLGGLLAHFDRTRHRHVLVDLQPTADTTGRHLHALADEIIDACGLDDAALLQRLRELDLDVAIDLAGYSTGNRLAVLAQRVAPLQVCWLDWFDTTAVPAMDAWISDAWLTPADSTQRYTERVMRLDAGRFCYTPITSTPITSMAGDNTPIDCGWMDGVSTDRVAQEHAAGNDSPALVHEAIRPVVFGSFNRLAKFNDAVIDVWAQILLKIPDAQLELRARLLGDAETRTHYIARFARRGIDAKRLRLRGELPYRDLLAAYRQVDIALDPFPFSGCTTTCDALWMGCPTITLPGETFVSRQSASLLWRLGRGEWVAQDGRDYVERAVALAADIASLRAGRGALRERVESRLCDSERQAIEFADMLDRLVRA